MSSNPNPEEAALHAIDRALAAGDPWQRQWFFAEALELHRQAREAREAQAAEPRVRGRQGRARPAVGACVRATIPVKYGESTVLAAGR
jgi:hypothetical protein